MAAINTHTKAALAVFCLTALLGLYLLADFCVYTPEQRAEFLDPLSHVNNDKAGNGGSSPITLTPGSAITAGDLVVACVEWVPTTSTASVSGNNSGAYTASAVGKKTNGTTVASEAFYKQNASADTSLTITVGSATSINASMMEFSGAATSGGEDGTASGTGSSTSPASGTLTSTGTTDVGIGCGVISIGADTWSAGSGFTLATSTVSRVGHEWKVFSAAINQTIGFTLSPTSTAWIVSADAFQAAGGGAACTPTLTLLGVGRCG